MKLLLNTPVLALLMLTSFSCFSQENSPVNFDKVTVKDFSQDFSNIDTSYGAIILADIGKSSFAANSKGYFTLVYKLQRRIKIISKKGFDIATINIPLYKSTNDDSEESLEALKATTYNLVGGKVEETKLDKDNVYKEVQDRNHSLRKFTMPAIKEGSIIDIFYTINSDFLFNLQPWSFQGSYPRIWSEYELSLPQFFKYVTLKTGNQNFHVYNQKNKFQSFNIRIPAANGLERDDIVSLSSTNTLTRWVMKDVPAIKEENFTSTIDNHLSRIEFQLAGRQFPDMPYKDIMGSWERLALDLMSDKEFSADFKNENSWLNQPLQTLGLDDKSLTEKARAIYLYVQKNFSNSGTKGIRLTQTLKETFKNKKGFVPDINLLLTLMLKKAGLNADPVIISTRSNGFATEEYPIVGQYNYVISKVQIENTTYYLDASQQHLGFSKLPSYCYNGVGTSINLVAQPEALHADSITERKVTHITLLNDTENKNNWWGNVNTVMGYYESVNARSNIQEKGKDAYIKKIEDLNSGDLNITEVKMDQLDNNDKPIQISYKIKMERDSASNLIYLNPFIKERIKENYFRSPDRKYPVELPFKIDESYIFYLEIPEGYVIDEVPKSAKVSLNESEGYFEYLISKSEKEISLRSNIKINKAIFLVDEYESLRNFFDYIVKKHAEQIVLKRKS